VFDDATESIDSVDLLDNIHDGVGNEVVPRILFYHPSTNRDTSETITIEELNTLDVGTGLPTHPLYERVVRVDRSERRTKGPNVGGHSTYLSTSSIGITYIVVSSPESI